MKERCCRQSRLSLLAVQSIACGVILLLALVLRLIGGETWDQLHAVFRQWLTDGGLADAWVEHLEERSAAETADKSERTVPTAAVPPLNEGRITSPFGHRTDPIRGGTGFHCGVDIAAPAEAPLYAVRDGEVVTAGWSESYGYRVVIRDADGWKIGYAHCAALLCTVGDTVRAGECVARVGSTGYATGNHVHVTAEYAGQYYDPTALLSAERYA